VEKSCVSPHFASLTRGAASTTFPRCQHRVARHCGCVLLVRSQQFAAAQPTHRRLRGTFRDADGLREFLIADLDIVTVALLFDSKPEIHQKCDGPPIVADQIAHQYVGNVIVKRGHRYTGHQYSIYWVIAVRVP